jgi:hypothetical protein
MAQSRHSQFGKFFGFVVFASLAASHSALAQRAELDPQRVFHSARPSSVALVPDATALRSRVIEIDRAAILEQDALVLDLFDGDARVAFRDRARPTPIASDAWVGRDPSDPSSQVNLIVRGDVVVGTIRAQGALYKIRPTGELGAFALERIDESRFPSCSVGRAHEVHVGGAHTPDAAGSANGALAATAATTIDVMVLYTAQAKAGAGSQTAIDALIDLAVLEANQSYVNSVVPLSLNLVRKQEIEYTESNNFNTDLSRLQSPVDGFMDSVHALRDTYKADLVSLIVNASSSCGIGYVMTNVSSAFQAYAFTVVSRTCATGYYSFAHELGHNLGCAHDRQTGGTGAYAYSYGYRNPSATWRTVMAYAPGNRIPYFSNPLVSYQGEVTGVSSASSLGCDNAKTMSLTAPITAAFRDGPPPASGSASIYGLGKLSSQGQRPELAPIGAPDVSINDFKLKLTRAIPRAIGFVHMSSLQTSSPFQGGTLYAALPLVSWTTFRTTTEGGVTLPVVNMSGLVGQTWHYQALFRDTQHLDHTGFGLSNGVKVTFAP